MKPTKPTTELFERITDAQYLAATNTLGVLRHNWPGYDDDDLLLFALAATVEPR